MLDFREGRFPIPQLQDMIVSSPSLRDSRTVRCLTYLEVLVLRYAVPWQAQGPDPPKATWDPRRHAAGPKKADLIKGNQWVFIGPDHKAGHFLGGPTWHWGGRDPWIPVIG